GRRKKTSRAAEALDETRRSAVQRSEDDGASNAARVDEFSVTDVDDHVRDFVIASERQQIDRLKSIASDRLSDQRLLIRSPRQGELDSREHEAHEAATVETVLRRTASQRIRLSDHRPRDRND